MRTDFQLLRRDIAALQDIANAMSKAMSYEKRRLETSEMAFDATIRQVEVAGEAAKRLSDRIKEKYKTIDWKSLSGIRDKLIHQYDNVDGLILWDTVKENFPVDHEKILKIIDEQINLLKQLTQETTIEEPNKIKGPHW